ncbi:CCG-binding protein [Actinidia chinensis var. chinensis]|uniref:CCG-binding protein n=1 Tax=Actinidia chinensis var. chinensis TaxID=1590841 RepID=A0A2R6RH79_ACTCC|nr:CCG-binding protein [Actinidia chinensis var. chinensis]
MMRSVVVPSSSSFVVEPNDPLLLLHHSRPRSSSSTRFGVVGGRICCSSSGRNPYVKVATFNKPKTVLDRFFENLPLVQKTQNEISDYCVVLEGDPCYDCWRAYFELGELERLAPKEEVERLIRGANGVKDLVSSVHGMLSIYQNKKERSNESSKAVKVEKSAEPQPPPHVPEWLPKSEEELEEEERARMNDSPHTRLLRVMGRSGRRD